MRVTVCGVSGPAAGVVVPVRQGAAVTVGRSEEAEVSVPADTFLSGLHFSLEGVDVGLRLQDLGSRNGTFVDGIRVQQGVLMGLETVTAGGSVFRFGGCEAAQDDLRSILCCGTETLFVILDAARDPEIYPLLCASGARFVSLYAGRSAMELEHVAPYLAEMSFGGTLMETFLRKGWGNAWGVLLRSSSPMEEVWKQLRRALMVTLEAQSKQAYFRFYDPRVLRVFLGVADPVQVGEFGGPIRSWMMEDSDPGVLIYFHGWTGAGSMCRVRVDTAAG